MLLYFSAKRRSCNHVQSQYVANLITYSGVYDIPFSNSADASNAMTHPSPMKRLKRTDAFHYLLVMWNPNSLSKRLDVLHGFIWRPCVFVLCFFVSEVTHHHSDP